MDALIGGRYRLGTLLGTGSVARVYRAVDLRLARPVAVKLFRADPDPVARLRFRHEAAALARLTHPGLVPVFDVGVDADRPFLVMRLIEGDTVAARLPFDVSRVAAIATTLAAACGQVHQHGMVHRDIKPANILLDRSGHPCLADFGIVLLADASRLTATDEVIGTAAYLSPEQVLGEPIGPPSDIYSLGLTLLECLTGRLEYGGGPPGEVAVARLHREPVVPDWVPPELAELLRAMTARDPRDRPSAADCVARLSGRVPVRRRRRGLAAAVAGAAVCVVVGLASTGAVTTTGGVPGAAANPPAGSTTPVPATGTSANPAPSPAYLAPATDPTTTHDHGKGKGRGNGNNGNHNGQDLPDG